MLDFLVLVCWLDEVETLTLLDDLEEFGTAACRLPVEVLEPCAVTLLELVSETDEESPEEVVLRSDSFVKDVLGSFDT